MKMAPRKLLHWEEFVVANGEKAHAYELAAVIGRPVDDIQRLRSNGVCARLTKPKTFDELFTLWHGRAPTDDDWPAPRKMGANGAYEWQPPEVAMLASLVGQVSQDEIAEVLTARLQEKTGDSQAERTPNSVQTRTNLIGLQTTDVIGGLTTAQAAREIGSFAIVNQTIAKGDLPTRRVGRLHVIPYEAWQKWKATRVFPPAGHIQLSTIRDALGIRSDKLSEYARMGLIPTAIRCNPYGTKGPSTQFGTWWISKETSAKLLADRRAGCPMPWHGRYTDNLRTTFKLWEMRKHPKSCSTCAEIWGEQGAPKNFEEYSARYLAIAHGAKRHLTRPWSPGLTLREVAIQAERSIGVVRTAIENGVLAATTEKGRRYVSRTDATRWCARHCPTGEGPKSWIALKTACDLYFFTIRELRALVDAGDLKTKTGTNGAARGVVYVSRHQCGQLREKIGFTEEQAARRLGITVARFKYFLEGVHWRKADKIPLVTLQAVRKRMDSRHGYTIEEAASALNKTEQWVREQIKEGAARISRAKWDRRRIYLTEPMFQRLREKAEAKAANHEQLSAEWLTLSEAAMEAGVSLATMNAWGLKGDPPPRESKGVRHYHRAAVRARARKYWQSIRFHRATPPEWLVASGIDAGSNRSKP
ncbi:MAG: hypothetical protein OEL20_05165 [Sulfuritalea sp.]|nr:hypothetical protein [Sulfuritalea sp.]